MLLKATKLSPAPGDLAVSDSSEISPRANDSVVTDGKHGIIKGYPDNTLRPGARATRAEAPRWLLERAE
ncbi:MAG: S-layer homology domain-containing protein [Armatimonadetes bacterium]|nr:S-layer homology domain-containing protein [Armatimonadota bacterium]